MKKNSTPNWGGGQNFMYESKGGVTNMISISFSGIKMLWLLGGLAKLPLRSLIFSFFIPYFSPPPPPKNEDMKRYAYAKMPSVIYFCGNAHRHLIMHKYRQMHIDIWEVF